MDYKRFPHQDYRFWLYDPEGEGLMFFRDVIERDEAAVNAVEGYRSLDGWDEEVENVCCGTLTHVTRMLDRQDRPDDLDEDGIDGDGVYWPEDVDFMGTYTLVSVEEE